MKLPIRKKYFDQIKEGKKELEMRSAHITFVCEETGETLRRYVAEVCMFPKNVLKSELRNSKMFQEDMLIGFVLSKTKPKLWKKITPEKELMLMVGRNYNPKFKLTKVKV